MPEEAKAEWRRIMPKLIERRILTRTDLASVENYCLAIGQVRQCAATLAKEGNFVESENGAPRPHRAFRVQHSAMTQARQLAAELGLTPVSRNRPQVNETEKDSDGWSGMDI